MDGNGRWAQKRRLPRTVGHAKGAAGVKALVQSCVKKGIPHLTIFAFSTENWRRPADEVSTLMGLFIQYLEKEINDLAVEGVRLKVIGDVRGFTPELQECIKAAEAVTAGNSLITLCIAANYGGRWDMLQAFQNWQTASLGLSACQLTEATLGRYLSTADMPEVDLLIRTGGERRISNFLLWQSAYAELYFTDVLWPEFDGKELDKALEWFAQRTRRFGKTTEQIVGQSEKVSVAR